MSTPVPADWRTEAAARDWEAPVRRYRPKSPERPSAPPWERRKTDADGRYLEEEAVMDAAKSEELGLAVGDLVTHERFGHGRIEAIEVEVPGAGFP